MSKVLKVFVNLILLLFILTGIALLVPPLVGVTTVVAEEGMVTNMQTGSVAYALKKPLSELKAGDKILQTGEDSAYVYEITSLNAETGVVTVRPSDGAATQELTLRNTAQKEVITVPLIGYVSIAMQTTEGLSLIHIFFKKPPGGIGLPSQLGNPFRNIHIKIGISVHPAGHLLQIFCP